MGMKPSPEVAEACLRLAGVNPLTGASESHFQSRVVRLAKANGWAVFHVHDSRRSEPGFPDLVMIRAGALVVAELKVKRNKTTADQERWLKLFGEVPGVRAFRWRPEQWESIRAVLEGRG